MVNIIKNNLPNIIKNPIKNIRNKISSFMINYSPDIIYAYYLRLFYGITIGKKRNNLWMIKVDDFYLYSTSPRHTGISLPLFEDKFDSIVKIEPNDVVMDIGASIGDTSVQFARKCSMVVAVEPEPSNIMCLAQNLIGYNYQIISKALWNIEGSIELKISKFVTGHSLTMDTKDKIGKINVKTNTLSGLIKESYRPVTYLKIDVQGAEPDCFLGSEKVFKEINKIVIETHNTKDGCTTDAVKAFLTSNGIIFKTKEYFYGPDRDRYEIVYINNQT